jgi:hypothetical protein
MSTDSFAPWMIWTLALVVAGLILFLVRHRYLSARAREEAEEREFLEEMSRQVKQLHQAGVVDEHGQPLCEVCGEVATHPYPEIGPSDLDKKALVRWFAKLHSMPWHYTVKVVSSRPRVCRAHAEQAHEVLEAFASTLRAEHGSFNQRLQNRCLHMNRGDLIRQLRKEEDLVRSEYKDALTPPAERVFKQGESPDE